MNGDTNTTCTAWQRAWLAVGAAMSGVRPDDHGRAAGGVPTSGLLGLGDMGRIVVASVKETAA
ncbi:hypothetical protein [Thermobifida cellulosilytica]|uniref:hypothetical protein n=1 Tax=Thermobifida cellulosilytica TaxID=144786 RepID=UPI000A67D8B1|nr:hypothetical protein [Thermobifida cellulosilytica]